MKKAAQGCSHNVARYALDAVGPVSRRILAGSVMCIAIVGVLRSNSYYHVTLATAGIARVV